VFDVKVGRGAFMRTAQQGLELARILIDLAASLGKRATAVLSDMNQPLGLAVGNALEVKEAMDTLRGRGPSDFTSHCLALGVQLLLLTRQAENEAQARSRLEGLLLSGQALGRFRDLIEAQGGDPSPIDDPGLLPQAPVARRVKSPKEGYISQVDAMVVGLTALELGAGRKKKGEPVDHAVGVVLHKKIGDSAARGDDLCTIHARTDSAARKARTSLLEAYAWQEEPVDPPPLIYHVVS
jgi:pyrimidine-nucleoside phosphorylase